MANLICTETKEVYNTEVPRWKSDTGALLDLSITPFFDLEKIKSRAKCLWRYREALPIENEKNILSVDEGFTPLLELAFDNRKVLIKQEQLFSSGSYKDRGASVLMSKVKELGIKKVVQDSSGNAGCAIAMYSAMANIDCDIYVPANTSDAKLAQMKMYGANIHKIKGSREDTASAALEAARHHYYASHCRNPYFFQGTKTFAYEVCEQLNWNAPDSVVLPAGNGTLLIGCYIGFKDLLQAGIISKMPKLIAVQSENCAPLYHAFNKNENDISDIETQPTIAEGIAIAKPVRAKQMLQMVRETNGLFITVTEGEIISSVRLCGQMGFYIEPTSAATIGGLRKYLTQSNDEIIVSLFSGHGLKATEKIMKLI